MRTRYRTQNDKQLKKNKGKFCLYFVLFILFCLLKIKENVCFACHHFPLDDKHLKENIGKLNSSLSIRNSSKNNNKEIKTAQTITKLDELKRKFTFYNLCMK